MNAVDTNVLLYVHDPREPEKRKAAVSLLLSLEDGVLVWQVACEYIAACRKLAPYGYDPNQAWSDVRDLASVWTVLLPDWSVLAKAEQLSNHHKLSIWDSMIVASCLVGGVGRLYSEDFSGHPKVETVEIVNPFRTR